LATAIAASGVSSGPSSASAASDDAPDTGSRRAYANPFTVARPIRSPVKLPGPRPTANPVSSPSDSPAAASSSSRAPGNRSLIFDGGPRRTTASASASPARPTASERVVVELSIARIIGGPEGIERPAPPGHGELYPLFGSSRGPNGHR